MQQSRLERDDLGWTHTSGYPRISVSMRDSPTLVSCLDDVAVMGDPVQQRGSHLLVTEDLRPLAKGKVGGDDHRGTLVELGEQMEQELAGVFYTATDQWVLIDQLERTDHTHLGQLMTYAAGLNAVTIVWVSSRFTDEHRAALDWLNEITSNEFRFFGLEIELWRIGSSPPAPKFNIVSKPNDWTKPSGGAQRRFPADLTLTKQRQLEYWEALHEVMEKGGGNVRLAKPTALHWQNFPIGPGGFSLTAFTHTRANRIGIRLILRGDNAKAHYGLLSQEKEAIEQEVNEKFEWSDLPGKKVSHIKLRWHNCDPTDRESWSEQHRWLFEKLKVFHRVFASRIKELGADEFVEGNE